MFVHFILIVISAMFIEASELHQMLPNSHQYNGSSTDDIYDFYDTDQRIVTSGDQNSRILKSTLTTSDRTKLVRDIVDKIQIIWQTPIVVLLDDTKQAHGSAELVMKTIFAYFNTNDFWLMKFNSTGVSPVLAKSSLNKELFINSLKWEYQATLTSLGSVPSQRGVAFFGVLKAARLLPVNGGMIIFTNRGVDDEDIAHLAVKEIIDKKLKLFVIWGGIYPTANQEENLLKEAAFLSGGDFIVNNSEKMVSDLYNYETNKVYQTKVLIANYVNITGIRRFYFPIDPDVTSIHISATANVKAVQIINPQGRKVNLLDSTEVEHFSPGSFGGHPTKNNKYEIELHTANQAHMHIVGIWRLNVEADERGCNITISVQTKLNVTTHIVNTYETSDIKSSETKRVLRIALSVDDASIRNITLLDKNGFPLRDELAFSSNHVKPELTENEGGLDPKKQVDVDISLLPSTPFYLKISGEDNQGNAFSRLSYFETDRVNYLLKSVTVDVGAGSQLIAMPNEQARIYFEVTNNRDQVVHVQYRVQDERSLLSTMTPYQSWLNPKETVIVTVTSLVSKNVGSNFRNLITFTVSGTEYVQKQATMYVTTTRIIDTEEPRLTYRYSSDCTSVLLGRCEDSTWMIEVTAEDRGSGLLQLTSVPRGLHFPNGYVAGTKEPVLGMYGGSCCEPKLQLTAIDLLNNRRTYNADAYYAALNAGSIAAIVLGFIVLIIIIILIVILCKTKCCQKKGSADLPTYRSPHGNTQSR